MWWVEMRPPPPLPEKPHCYKSQSECGSQVAPKQGIRDAMNETFGKREPAGRKSSASSSRRSSDVSSLESISDASRASDMSDDDEGASRTSSIASRIVLSIVATILLWATSLSVINAWIYSIIPMPGLLDTYDKVYLFVNNTQDEERDYSSCVNEELVQCNRSLDLDIDIVLNGISDGADGVLEILEKNQEKVAIAQSYSRNCSRMYTDSLSALIAWQNEQPFDADPEAAFTPECTQDERDYLMVRAAAAGMTPAFREQTPEHPTRPPAPQKATGVVNETFKGDAYGLIEGYTGYSSDVVAELSERIRARQAYDAEYLANKTALIEEINRLNRDTYYDLQQKIDALGLNMSLDIDMHLLTINTSELLSCNTLAGGACAAGVSMRDRIAEMKQDMTDQYNQAVLDYENAVRDVREKGREELDRAQAYYDETMENAERAVAKADRVITQVTNMFNRNVSCQTLLELQDGLISTRFLTPRRNANRSSSMI